jgi:hypothetical protein
MIFNTWPILLVVERAISLADGLYLEVELKRLRDGAEELLALTPKRYARASRKLAWS